MPKQKHVEENAGIYSAIKIIEEDGFEDVYCIYVPETHNFVSNGIVSHNCDALRYVMASHKVAKYEPYAHDSKDYLRDRFEPRGRF